MARTIVKRYKGERRLQRGINQMSRKGYGVQSQATRKRAFRFFGAGIFTRQQIHTVTFTKQ